ncbi:Uncharacterized protein QTN25_006742 [Entamoeba marina]
MKAIIFCLVLISLAFAKDKKQKKSDHSQIIGVKTVKDLVLPDAVMRVKARVIQKLQQQLKLTSSDATNMAERMLANLEVSSLNPTIEHAKAVARKVKEATKSLKKHVGKPCGDDLINLVKMFDNKVTVNQFDMNKMHNLIDDAVKRIVANRKLKEVKCLLNKDKKLKKVLKKAAKKTKKESKETKETKKEKTTYGHPFKLTLAEQYPEVGHLIPDAPSDILTKVDAKKVLQNKVIRNI